MSQTIQVRRGNAANVPSTALPGEPLFTLDTHQLFVGTGTGLKEIASKDYVDTQIQSRSLDAGTF